MAREQERRKYPRVVDKDISVKLSANGIETITQSLDVSASGIYCKVAVRIPVMTRLQMVLSIPDRARHGNRANLNIEGIVVRENPVMRDGRVEHYDIAIFFNSLTQKERESLIDYIHSKHSEL